MSYNLFYRIKHEIYDVMSALVNEPSRLVKWLHPVYFLRASLRRLKIILGLAYSPSLTVANKTQLINEVADYFDIPLAEVELHYEKYHSFYESKDYENLLGEETTLCFEEAFILYVLSYYLKPSKVVEIGTEYGRSTRRILDMLKFLDIEADITCFDVADQVQYFTPVEARLIIHDLTDDFSERVLQEIAPTLIYLDAHPYALLKTVISRFLEWDRHCILAIHDCSPGLFNPNMTISKDDVSSISSFSGHWERHVLSELFSASNMNLDDIKTQSHRLRIFKTRHGLALISLNTLWSEQGSLPKCPVIAAI